MTNPEIIIEKIKKEHVTPVPAWFATAQNICMWGIGILFATVGAVSLAVVTVIMVNNDWDIYRMFDPNLVRFILVSIPYIWVSIGVVCLFIVYSAVRHTKRGYKYNVASIIIASLGLSICGASLFHIYGVSRRLDATLVTHVPYYAPIAHPRVNRWHHPEKGYIAGVVEEIAPGKSIIVRDRRDRVWLISTSSTQSVYIGMTVRTIGVPANNNHIQAMRILPWDRLPAQKAP